MFQPSTTWIDRFRGQNASQKISNSTILPEASCDEGNFPDFIEQGLTLGGKEKCTTQIALRDKLPESTQCKLTS